jgi:hypothetical protein
MGFIRHISPAKLMQGAELTAAMVGIGMNFAAAPQPDANIEDTLLAASIEGLERDDLRVLAILVSWIEVHGTAINADRLTAIVAEQPSARVRAFWRTIAKWRLKDRRFARLGKINGGPLVDLLPVGTAFQIKRTGEDPRFAGGPLRVPANALRDREADVLTPRELIRKHRAYRCRVMLGPSYRADMWAALEADPTISSADLARRTYGSFATAWQAKQDFNVLAGQRTPSPGAA